MKLASLASFLLSLGVASAGLRGGGDGDFNGMEGEQTRAIENKFEMGIEYTKEDVDFDSPGHDRNSRRVLWGMANDDGYDDDEDYKHSKPSYSLYKSKGCRNKHGEKGYEHHDFDLYFHKSRHFCESKCTSLGWKCYGYEYGIHDEKCEIWKAPIHNVEHKNGLDCYIKD
jgi:hypothetical protein